MRLRLLFGLACVALTLGQITISGRQMVGGTPANEEDYRFIAAIGRSDADSGITSYNCTGVLVDEWHVLTAAHCVTNSYGDAIAPGPLLVTLGITDLLAAHSGTALPVAAIAVHPGWDTQTLMHDVAVLTLANPAVQAYPDGGTRGPQIAQAVLADDAPPPGTVVEVAGFGVQGEGDDMLLRERADGSMLRAGQTTLLMAFLPLVERAQCQAGLESAADADPAFDGLQVADSQLCAGLPSNSPDACQGDSGGPMLSRDGDGTVRLWGLVSYGAGCGRAGQYGVYTRLGGQGAWLAEALNAPPTSATTSD